MSIKEDHENPATLLRPEERLISVQEVPVAAPVEPLPPLQALQLLANAQSPEDIGRHGPLLASHALPENKDQPALRLYETVFGRDSIISAYFLLEKFPLLAQTTLRRLAELQGTKMNAASEEEPGEIIHEARDPQDPIAQELTKTRGWQWPYYGSVDATPLFIILLAAYVHRHAARFLQEEYTDRDGHTRTMLHALQQAVAWILTKTKSNPDGLVESRRLNHTGHINQVWKDSRDSYHHKNGTLANPDHGIASIEAQAYAHDALREASELLSAGPLQDQCQKAADRLGHILLKQFWIEEGKGGYFALGSDRHESGELQLLNVRTSNMGHLLNSRLLEGKDHTKMREAIVAELFKPTLLTAHGIRTLAANENRFRPNSYHNGSVWPWDTFYISLGLQRHSFMAEAQDLQQRIAHTLSITKCFPEFVSGAEAPQSLMSTRTIRVFDTHYQFEHAIEQPPQEIQAWTVAAAVVLDF